MSLDLEIQSLLRSREVNQIDFTMNGIHISGHGFWELSNCFANTFARHRVRVTVRPQLVPGNAEAQYDPTDDKINLRSPNVLASFAGCGAVVHECTHAQLDLRAVATPVLSEEAAAFIAEAWYYLACRQNIATVAPGFPAAISAIAMNLRAQARQSLGAPVALSANEINAARSAMVQLGYTTGHYTSNGIRGRRYHGM